MPSFEEQREKMWGKEVKESKFVGQIGRTYGMVPGDKTMKSFAYWHDPNEKIKILVGKK